MCSLRIQDRALWQACDCGDVIRAQELLLLGADINNHGNVSYSAHILCTQLRAHNA